MNWKKKQAFLVRTEPTVYNRITVNKVSSDISGIVNIPNYMEV